jgi:hypothetical protein
LHYCREISKHPYTGVNRRLAEAEAQVAIGRRPLVEYRNSLDEVGIK